MQVFLLEASPGVGGLGLGPGNDWSYLLVSSAQSREAPARSGGKTESWLLRAHIV